MEIGLGQKYRGGIDNVAVAAAPVDLFTYTAAAGVPALLMRITASGNVTGATVQRILAVLRSTAGSGGTSPAATAFANCSPAGPAMSGTIAYNVTTPGTLVSDADAQQWDQLAFYEWQWKEGGLLIVPGATFALNLPAGGSFTGSIGGFELVEIK